MGSTEHAAKRWSRGAAIFVGIVSGEKKGVRSPPILGNPPSPNVVKVPGVVSVPHRGVRRPPIIRKMIITCLSSFFCYLCHYELYQSDLSHSIRHP